MTIDQIRAVLARRNSIPELVEACGELLEQNDKLAALARGCEGSEQCWRESYYAKEDEVAELTAERDAYKRAKAENDERYLVERDAARSERDQLRARVAELERSLFELRNEKTASDAAHERELEHRDRIIRYDHEKAEFRAAQLTTATEALETVLNEDIVGDDIDTVREHVRAVLAKLRSGQ